MKKHLAILVIIAAAALSFRSVSGPSMYFDETKHNFGFIRQGETVSHEYTFTNKGDAPLIITDCEVACECTKVTFPKEPVAPNGTGKIKVTFDSKSAMDRQERTVIVKSNAANSPVTLVFKCVVLKPKN
ncbi:MAG: DUF1573 domain-containing protein [Bacteroidia bacterium]|nr:DUF1573 domain-containing protein [Bacteroidia bacterium]